MSFSITLITLLRIPYLGRIGSTKLVLPKWHKYGILNRVIRVLGGILGCYFNLPNNCYLRCKTCANWTTFKDRINQIYYVTILTSVGIEIITTFWTGKIIHIFSKLLTKNVLSFKNKMKYYILSNVYTRAEQGPLDLSLTKGQ